jgi:hypothetical protein
LRSLPFMTEVVTGGRGDGVHRAENPVVAGRGSGHDVEAANSFDDRRLPQEYV